VNVRRRAVAPPTPRGRGRSRTDRCAPR
jgi:hypothetical protein